MSKYRIEKDVPLPKRGPKRRFTDLPLNEMEPGDSIKVTECRLSRRPSIYNSVRQVIEDAQAERRIRGEYTASTIALGADKCEVRVFRVR